MDAKEAPETIVIGTLEDSGVPQVPLDATGSRDILGPEEIQRTGARDLNDLVQYLPAVSTRPYSGGESSAPSFSMRGLPDDGLTEYILVAIDGVPTNPMPYGWTAFSFFPLMTEQVHAIDLIRGGYSVRYSPNTVGGVLNLLTPPIPAEETYTFRSSFGSHGYFSEIFSAGDDDGRFGYLVTAGERHGDGYRLDSPFQYQTFDVKTRWMYGQGDWLATRVGYIENEHRPPGGLTQQQFAENPFGSARPENLFRGHRAVADVVRHVDDGNGYTEWFGWLSQTRRNLSGDRPSFGEVTEHRVVDDDAYNGAVGVRAEERVEWLGHEHSLYYGARVAQELLPNRTTTSTSLSTGEETLLEDSEYELTSISAHLDDTVDLTEGWKVVAGLRAEYIPIAKGEGKVTGGEFDDEFSDLLPAVSSSYQLTDQLALYAGYQESFRAPQVWGFDVGSTASDQDLNFESGDSAEIGLRADLTSGLSGSIAGWTTSFDDVGIFTDEGYRTIGNIEAEGIDYVLRWDAGQVARTFDGFSAYASYTMQDSELGRAVDQANDGNETPYAWEDKVAWSLQYATEDAWTFALGGVYVGESFSDEVNTVAENENGNIGLNESRTIWDAQIAKELRVGEKARARFMVGVTNLLDEDWFVHSRGGFFGGGKVVGPPREIYFGMSWSF